MLRHRLLTSTTYGTWLPGDERGFVSTVLDRRPEDEAAAGRRRHNVPGTEIDADMAGLRRSALANLMCPPILLSKEQAVVVIAQFRETAQYRAWNLRAAAVMANHLYLVVAAPDEVHSTSLLRDFKSYASRALNQAWDKPASGTWWTESGSRRPLRDERAVEAAIRYVLNQYGALALWSPERGA